jgi:hypothetical protein
LSQNRMSAAECPPNPFKKGFAAIVSLAFSHSASMLFLEFTDHPVIVSLKQRRADTQNDQSLLYLFLTASRGKVLFQHS